MSRKPMKTQKRLFILTLALSVLTLAEAANASDSSGSRGPAGMESWVVTSASGPPLSALPLAIQANTRIVFQSRRTGNYEIFFGNGDLVNEVQITNNPASDFQPRLNRGATRVVFVSDRDGNDEIYSMKTDGGDLLRLTNHPAGDNSPYWTPDGTHILFSSTRDGNSEIYRMDVTGGELARLTFDSAYDGEPGISADGTRVAFISDRGGQARQLWVMDPDGANPAAIPGGTRNSSPVPSFDGSKVAFHGIWDSGTGEADLMTIDVNGDHRRIVKSGADVTTDAIWMNSWSPDGNYIAYTEAHYLWQDYWRVIYTYLRCVSTQTGNVIQLTSNYFDSNVDWQALDTSSPTSTLLAVDSISAAPVILKLLGASPDAAADPFSVTVQARDGVAGAWTTFATLPGAPAMTTTFAGRGGHTYFFRSRAYDTNYNFEAWPPDAESTTTVEMLPPISEMTPLTSLTRTPQFQLGWSGSDSGGSGIAAYDLQVRAGMFGAWSDLLTRTLATSTTFAAPPGETYYFRVRATDTAGNIEDWPSGNGDTYTRNFVWRIDGNVYDNAGAPVSAAQPEMPQAPFVGLASGADGAYAAIALSATNNVSMTVYKTGYGVQASTRFPIVVDARRDFYLLPVDNVIRNGGFESSPTKDDWVSGGARSTAIADRHTGLAGLSLGGIEFEDAAQVGDASGVSCASLTRDVAGNPRAFWIRRSAGVEQALYLGSIQSAGLVQPEVVLTEFSSGAGAIANYCPDVGIDADGSVHALWRSWPAGDVFYARRAPSSGWTVFLIASGLEPESIPRMGLDSAGAAHLVWHVNVAGRRDIVYLRRDAVGVWSALQNLTAADPYAGDSRLPAIAVDAAGVAYLAWQNGTGYIASRPAAGGWSAPQAVFEWPFMLSRARIRVGPDGVAHAAWQGATPSGLTAVVHTEFTRTLHSQPETILVSALPITLDSLEIDTGGQPAFVVSRGDGSVWHGTRDISNTWSTTRLSRVGAAAGEGRLAMTAAGAWSIWREVNMFGDSSIQCGRWDRPTGWMGFGECGGAASGGPALLAAQADQLLLMFPAGPDGIRYASWPDTPALARRLSQTVTLSSGLTTPGLSFIYRFDRGNPGPGPILTVTAEDSSGAALLFSAQHVSSDDWRHVWRDMTAWSGMAVTLTFEVDGGDGGGAARLLIDEVSVGSTAPDLWIESNLPSAAIRGSSVIGMIRYGNRGGGFAAGVLITLTLPAGMTFDSADPAPIAIAPALVWQLSDLSGQTADNAIVVTATVDLDASSLAILTQTLTIRSTALELELLNNEWLAGLFVGQRAYAPVVFGP